MKIINTEPTDKEILDALISDACVCGSKKKTRMSHCRNCYFSLPSKIRSSLYRRFGDGYEDAYRKSLKFLEGN